MLSVNLMFQSLSNEYMDIFFKYISFLITDIPLVIVLSYLYWCVSKKNGFKAGIVLLSSMQLNFILKNIFKLERPYVKDKRIINKDTDYGYGYSFPSNHSQIAATILTLFNKYFKLGKSLVYGSILVVLIALSRVYLGVHSVLDVLAGAFLGWLVCEILTPLINKIMEKKKYYILYLIGVLGIISGFVLGDEDGIKILNIYLGFVTGYLFEMKFINYIMPKKFSYRIINYLIGLIGVAIIYIFLNNAAKYLLIGAWVTFFAPCIFKVIRKESSYEPEENQ